MEPGYVKSHTEHGITTIEFFHPKSNSLPLKSLDELNAGNTLCGNSRYKSYCAAKCGNRRFLRRRQF